MSAVEETVPAVAQRVRPLGDRVLVKPDDPAAMSGGGVILPPRAQEESRTGKVLAVGAGLPDENGERVRPQVFEDDTVIFSRYGGVDVKINGEDLLIVREGDLLGVIEDA